MDSAPSLLSIRDPFTRSYRSVSGPQNRVPVVQASKPLQLTEETVKLLVEQQGREAELRTKELEVRLQELRNNSAHAEKVLGAQERDLADERAHVRGVLRDRLAFAGVTIVAIIGLICVGMYLGKDALVSDLIKVIGGAVAGALGGYGWARAHDTKGNSPQQDD